jgi:hypothetical protein
MATIWCQAGKLLPVSDYLNTTFISVVVDNVDYTITLLYSNNIVYRGI